MSELLVLLIRHQVLRFNYGKSFLYLLLVSPEGIEPSTLGLKGRCSTGLSYGPTAFEKIEE